MTVHVVMPVFNRLDMTRQMIACLNAQQTDEDVHLVIVNDGSTDGTAEYLASMPAITVLEGDGALWWGGAVDLAIRHVMPLARENDWLLFVNNDTLIQPNFVQCLLNAARQHTRSAVGSIIRDDKNGRLLSIGAIIDPIRLIIGDLIDEKNEIKTKPEIKGDRVFDVDALSGRGVLLPLAGVRAAGGMRPNWLPHYLADYELACRMKSAGWRLIVSEAAVVYSKDEYGNSYRFGSFWKKLTSIRSSSYLPALIMFWWSASNWRQRLTLPFRALIFAMFPALRKK